MKEYKEKDKRADDMIKLLDYYYDEDNDSPLIPLVDKTEMTGMIDTLREEYGIFYSPQVTYSMSNTMEKYRMDICKAIGVEKVWCWSTTINEAASLKRRYDNLLEKYNKLAEGGHLNDDQYVTIPRKNYDILVEESCHLDWLMNILEEDYCIHNFTSRDAFMEDMDAYIKCRKMTEKTDNKSDLDLLFEELKKLEKEIKDDTKWKKNNIWLKSSITKSEESNGSIHNKVEFYIYHRSPEEDLTESFKYIVKQDANGYFYVICHNPYKKESDMSIPGILDYIKKEMEDTIENYADLSEDDFEDLVIRLEEIAEYKNRVRSDISVSVNTLHKGTDGEKYNQVIVVVTNNRDKKEYKVTQDRVGNFILKKDPKQFFTINDTIGGIVQYITKDIDKFNR